LRIKTIPYGHQWVDKLDIKEVEGVLISDWLTQGPKIKEFETALCKYAGAKYAVAVSSGTAALHLAYLAAGLAAGDEIITSPITFVATANASLYCGAKPIFADIDKDTINIDPEKIKGKITSRTRVIIPVHFAGHPCDMDEISKIAKKNGIAVIEDAAHALGAEYKGLKIGSCSHSDMSIFSFHPVKSITTGEGGAILTNKKDLYSKLVMLRSHGITKEKGRLKGRGWRKEGPWYYEMQDLGFNYRITDIQAALGLSQLKKIDNFIQRRREISDFYNKAFEGNEFFDIPVEKKYAYSSCHLYPIRLKGKFENRRKEVFEKMRAGGLGVQVHYIPVYLQPYYRKLGFKKGACPIAENYYNREISLPLYPALTAGQVKYVIDLVCKFFNKL
jgi:UDP-4-amino-4,6-dideoxy-N-acetyl-beta-L-altrosamine transaminase